MRASVCHRIKSSCVKGESSTYSYLSAEVIALSHDMTRRNSKRPQVFPLLWQLVVRDGNPLAQTTNAIRRLETVGMQGKDTLKLACFAPNRSNVGARVDLPPIWDRMSAAHCFCVHDNGHGIVACVIPDRKGHDTCALSCQLWPQVVLKFLGRAPHVHTQQRL